MPVGLLRSNLSRAINSIHPENEKVLVIEDGGMPITQGLKIKDPLRPSGCIFNDSRCPVKEGIDCDRTGVIYKIECRTCIDIAEDPSKTYNYIGLTRSSLHSRMLSHLDGQRRKKGNNSL